MSRRTSICLLISVLLVMIWVAMGFIRARANYRSYLDSFRLSVSSHEIALYEFQNSLLQTNTTISLSIVETQSVAKVRHEWRTADTEGTMNRGVIDAGKAAELIEAVMHCEPLRKMQHPGKFCGHCYVLTFNNEGALNSYAFDASTMKKEPSLANLIQRIFAVRSETSWQGAFPAQIDETQHLGLRLGSVISQFPPRGAFFHLWVQSMFQW